MRALCRAVLVTIAAASAGASGEGLKRHNSGEFMSMCRSAERSLDGDGRFSPEGAMCVGYLSGARDFTAVPTGRMICVPHAVTNFQLVRVYLKWVEAHPAQHHEDYGLGVVYAYGEAFPCKPSGKRP